MHSIFFFSGIVVSNLWSKEIGIGLVWSEIQCSRAFLSNKTDTEEDKIPILINRHKLILINKYKQIVIYRYCDVFCYREAQTIVLGQRESKGFQGKIMRYSIDLTLSKNYILRFPVSQAVLRFLKMHAANHRQQNSAA